MAFTNDAHVKLGDLHLRLDENVHEDTGDQPFNHWTRTVQAAGDTILGEGGQNLRPETRILEWTDFSGGEGQVVLDEGDPSSFRRFYRSEGIDFRTPGQFQLNQSALLTKPHLTGHGTATIQGSAFTDEVGTSTVVNTTDRRLNETEDIIKSTDQTPSAGAVDVTFHLYKDAPAETTVQGSALVKLVGAGAASGTDFHLGPWGHVGLATAITPGAQRVEVEFHLARGSAKVPVNGVCEVVDVTDDTEQIIASATGFPRSTAASIAGIRFTAQAGRSYDLRVFNSAPRPVGVENTLIVDKVVHHDADEASEVSVSVYNETGGAEVTRKTVSIFQKGQSAAMAGLVFKAAGSTDYTYRVEYDSGLQTPVLDKVVVLSNSGSVYNPDAIELGQGGSVWVVGSVSGAKPRAWTYNFSDDTWTPRVEIADAANSNTARALAHTDAYEYVLTSDKKVHQLTTSASNDYTAAHTAAAVGMAICQDRLFVLTQDASNAATVFTYAVDSDVSSGAIASTASSTVTTALVAADATLRQVMVGTPTGARFFVNSADGQSVIYEADSSGAELVTREVGRLEVGTKATAITYASGVTFIAGQFFADTGSTARSGLWIIDQNGAMNRVGYIRRDDPPAEAPASMQPYQNDVFILQGAHIWRWSLTGGGLFHEYELDPGDATLQRGIAVLQGHIFAAYNSDTEGVWVTGTQGTYRTAPGAWVSSVTDLDLPHERKVLESIEVLTNTLPDDTGIQVVYESDQDGTLVTLGTSTAGTRHLFAPSDPLDVVEFGNLQVSVTPISFTGTSTPTVKTVVLRSGLGTEAGQDEFFDLWVRCQDEDSSDHMAGGAIAGGDVAAYLHSLRARAHPLTFIEGYTSKRPGENITHKVRIEAVRQHFWMIGEGRMFLRLKVVK